MSRSLLFNLAALAALLPGVLIPASANRQVFWLIFGVAAAGPAAWIATEYGSVWQTGLAAALWFTVCATLLLFGILVATSRETWRLARLLFAYLFLLGALATIWHQAPGRAMAGGAPPVWLQAHILVAVFAYGMLTIAAVAAVAVLIKERALKTRVTNDLIKQLPAIAEGETLQVRLLMASAVGLIVTLVTGAAITWFEWGVAFRPDHKTILSLLTFLVLCILLFIHHRGGLGGRRAARYLLFAYLLLTLAYPGVKFVTDVLIG